MKKFVELVVAFLTGDDANVKAIKIQRQAESALKAHIASLEGDTITLEDRIEEAEEALAAATVNRGELIPDKNDYVKTLIKCQNDVDAAKEALEDHKLKIDFLKDRLALVTA